MRKKILVVDDDPDIAKVLKIKLTAGGYDVATAGDGYAALRAAKAQGPDLIIVDLMMPEMNGWQFVQKLRHEQDMEKFKNIPVLVLSALIGQEGLPGDMEMGDYYLTKPFDGDKVLAKVKEMLK